MAGHNVTNCNDIRLYEFRKTCAGNRIILEVEDDSVNKFKLWLYDSYTRNASLITAFARRFCKVPVYEDSIVRIQKIMHYVYHLLADEMMEITNARNDYIVNLALFNDVEILKGLLFRERMEYLTRVIEYLTFQSQQSSAIIPPLKLELTLTDEKEPENIVQCSICYEDKKKKEFANFNCCHSFCGDCVVSMMKTRVHADMHCPLCRQHIQNIHMQNEALQTEMYKHFQ
jgi:hypothetical protein